MPRSTPLRTPFVARIPYLMTCAAIACLGGRASAADGEVIYQGAPARVTANVEKWGKDCGVQPKSYTLNERPRVPVTQHGDHLVLRFPAGTVKSNECWSQNPALQLISTSQRVGSWRTRCETPPGDPKRETGVYEIVARDPSTLELTESSRYDWQLKESHCVATVRTVRVLSRISPPEAGDSLVPAERAERPEQPVEPDCVPGSLASLRVHPSRARVEPGQRLCFAARGKDAQGCVIKDPPLSWSVKPLGLGSGSMRGNCFRSAASAAEGEGRFRITASSGNLHARALVHVVTPDLSDITLHALPGAGKENLPSSEPAAEPGLQSATRVAARALRGPNRGAWLAALAGLFVLLAGAVTWLVVRKRAPHALAAGGPDLHAGEREASPPPPGPEPASAAAQRAERAKPAPKPTEPMICPQCRRGYAPGAERCESDGTLLITYKAFSAQPASDSVACKACGVTFSAGTTFCGKCGARLSS